MGIGAACRRSHPNADRHAIARGDPASNGHVDLFSHAHAEERSYPYAITNRHVKPKADYYAVSPAAGDANAQPNFTAD